MRAKQIKTSNLLRSLRCKIKTEFKTKSQNLKIYLPPLTPSNSLNFAIISIFACVFLHNQKVTQHKWTLLRDWINFVIFSLCSNPIILRLLWKTISNMKVNGALLQNTSCAAIFLRRKLRSGKYGGKTTVSVRHSLRTFFWRQRSLRRLNFKDFIYLDLSQFHPLCNLPFS